MPGTPRFLTPLRTYRTRALAGAALSALLGAGLVACSETSLNEAPVIDLSRRAGPYVPAAHPGPAGGASAGEVLYTVQRGDTLFHLAANAHATVQDLARWNGLDERAPIFVGQQLRLHPPPTAVDAAPAVPAGAPAPATEGDGGAAVEAVSTPIPLGPGGGVETHALDAAPAMVPGAPANGAVAVEPAAGGANGMAPMPAADSVPGAPSVPAVPAAPPVPPDAAVAAPAAPGSAAARGWIWPADGPVTVKFDPVRSKGIEIAAAEDAPVLAVADGVVSYTGSPRDYGNLVILKHGDDLLSVYAHNKTIVVKEGQSVQRGQTIATAGKSPTGPSTLHFEVRRNHVPIDPLDVLPLR